MSGWTYGPSEAYAVQVLARHQMVERVLADVAQDMQICRIEGWDVWEYPRMLRDAIPAPPKGVGLMDEWLMPGIPRTIAEDPDMETVRRIRESVTSDTGQVVESDLLLPCPFCGARPYIQTHELGDTCVDARVVCPSCHVSTTRECQSWKVSYLGDDLTRTLAIGRAISLWNRRSERTCRNASLDPLDFKCSECGAEDYTSDSLTMWYDGGPVDISYCPVCGARIVEVSDDDRR